MWKPLLFPAFVAPLPLTTARNSPPRARRRARMSAHHDRTAAVPIPHFLRATRVLGLGLASADLLASVKHFPKPDEKLRTQTLSLFGGGNLANSMTALRRLGVPCTLVSKVGDDMYGHAVVNELVRDGIDARYVHMKKGVNTTFTYVIVEDTHRTRTCISTPANEDLFEHDVHESLLDGVTLLMLDGRHTLAAIRIAQMANERRIPVLLDMERDRPHIQRLLPHVDYLITNSSYPSVFSPTARTPAKALQRLLDHCQARFVISTRGSAGSMLIRRKSPRTMASAVDVPLQRTVMAHENTKREYELLECAAWPVHNIVDTTGAGDAFIGGVAYGIVTNMELERMMSLASYVAAAKLGALGARTALPRREHIPDALRNALPSG